MLNMSCKKRLDKITRSRNNDADERNIDEILLDVFPLKIDKNNIELTQEPVKDVKGLNSREITFNGEYNDIEISCVCVMGFGDAMYHYRQYYYGFRMSQKLVACRNMANYIGIFKADITQMADFISTPPKDLSLFIIKPSFTNGTVAQYMKTLRNSGGCLTPLHVVQMGIALFSTLSDAHTQSVGLVDITVDSLYVSLDLGLYFDGFQSCVQLHKESTVFDKPWMNVRAIKCPESKMLRIVGYKSSTDVFLAGVVLLEVIKTPECRCTKLYTHNRVANTIQIIEKFIGDSHKNVVPLIEKCLSPVPEDRPQASEVLHWLETLRHQSFATADS